jgi:hypothetical protein
MEKFKTLPLYSRHREIFHEDPEEMKYGGATSLRGTT